METASRKTKPKSTFLAVATSWPVGLLLGLLFLFGGMCLRAWCASEPDESVRLERARAMLRALGEDIHHDHAAERMQSLFPEGDVYTLTLYADGLINVSLACPHDEAWRETARGEIIWILERLSRPEVVAKFSDTEVPNGVYFLSHRTQLIAGLHLIDDSPPFALTEEYHENCRELARAITASPHGLLQSYPGGCWPADNVLALRCLALHDARFGSDYGAAVDKTLNWLRANLDPETGTIPHRVSASTGAVITPTRGCTMVLTLQYLIDVDIDLFNEQYRRMREHFLGAVLGIAPWREYPRGRSGRGDIDSGPVILGGGASATGVGAGTALLAGDLSVYCRQMALVEAFAFADEDDGGRRYWGGLLPVADGFAANSLSAVSWTGVDPDRALATGPTRPWALLGVIAAVYVAIAVPLVLLSVAAVRSRYRAARSPQRRWLRVEAALKILLLCVLPFSVVAFVAAWFVAWLLYGVVWLFVPRAAAAGAED